MKAYENATQAQGADLIVVEQLPVIKERLAVLSEEISSRVSIALSLECSEENKQSVKKARSELAKEFGEFEERRKAVKTAILTPYNDFEDAYKRFVSAPYQTADKQLKDKISAVEDEQKRRLREDAEAYFAEYAASQHIDFITFAHTGIKVGLSDNPTKLKRLATEFIDRVADDVAFINTQEHASEIMIEYQRTLSATAAVVTVRGRYAALAEIERRKSEQAEIAAAEEAVVARVEAVLPPPLSPPTAMAAEITDPVRMLAFRVTAPLSKLRELKKFLDDGGYQHE